jgi:hypothetical protein
MMSNTDNRPNQGLGGIPYKYLLTGILCLGTILRLMGLNKGIWLDEYLTIDIITRNDFLESMRSDTHPPLYYVLLKLWSHISISEQFLRLLSVILGIGTIIITMRWIKRYGLLASLITGLLYSAIPMLIRYSQEIRNYQLVLLLTACSFIFASRIAASPQKISGYIWLSLCLSIAAVTHLIGVLLIIPVLLFIILSTVDRRNIQWGSLIPAITLPSIIFLLEYLFFFKHLPEKSGWWMPPVSFQLISGTARQVFGISYLLNASELVQKHFSALEAPYIISIVFLAAVTLAGIIFFGDWRRSYPLFIAAACYWLEMILYSAFVTPIFWYRTVLPGIIPFLGFIGIQLSTIRVKWMRTASIAFIIIISITFAAGWLVRGAWVPYENWRETAGVLKTRWIKNDIAIFYPGSTAGPIRYYFTELPADSGIPIPIGEDISEVESKIHDRIHAADSRQDKYGIFLVCRSSRAFERDKGTYNKILEYLESMCGKTEFTQQSGNLSILEYRCRNRESIK